MNIMKKHFFVIDDDVEDVQLITAALDCMNADCKCTWARSGEQAVKQLQYLKPDVIFVDYNMYGMNGIQCLQAIKDLPNCKQVPVILHSSNMTEQLRMQGLQLGAYACLEKPDSLDRLMTVLQQFASKKASAA
jgi:CheY-like chemotaxis protein